MGSLLRVEMMLHDAIESLINCQTGLCFLWHGALGGGALLLGLWLAFEFWCRPYREEAGIYMNVLRDRAQFREESRGVAEAEAGLGTGRENGVLVHSEHTPLLLAADRARRLRQGEGKPEPAEPLSWKSVELASRPGHEMSSGAVLDGGEAGRDAAVACRESGAQTELEAPAGHGLEEAPVGGGSTENVIELGPWLGGARDEDLTLIEGVSARLQRELRELGIRGFDQIAHWSPGDVVRISAELGCGDAIDRQGWILQAKELDVLFRDEAPGAEVPFWNAELPAVLEAWEGEAVRRDAELGLVFECPPEVRDDLTRIGTLSPRKEKKLGEMGIYRLQQVALWSAGNVREIEGRLAMPGGTIEELRWRQQARRWHRQIYRASRTWTTSSPSLQEYEERIEEAYGGSAGGACVDEELGIVYRSAPDHTDDLTLVRGIGEMLASWLNDCGVYRFLQIGDWSMDNVQAFAERLDLPPGRILQEEWIRRAALVAGESISLNLPSIHRKLRA